MLVSNRSYARVVAWARIGLPLLALGLLSTLFLFSRSAVQTAELPFAEDALQERLRGQVLTAPYYAGTTDDGATVSLRAARALPGTGSDGSAVAEEVAAQIRLGRGEVIDISATRAALDDRLRSAELGGAVVIEASSGYRIETEGVTAGLGTMRAETAGPITGTAPEGKLSAGRLIVTSDAGGAAQFRFTEGVKLVYDPARSE